ncbi:MAG: DNA adenine methylase [Chitinophagales bacterium]
MKTPISYYGGKQKAAAMILKSLFLIINCIVNRFSAGAAIFAKPPSEVEVINDTNRELINFYRIVQNDLVSLETEIRVKLHSRDLHHARPW